MGGIPCEPGCHFLFFRSAYLSHCMNNNILMMRFSLFLLFLWAFTLNSYTNDKVLRQIFENALDNTLYSYSGTYQSEEVLQVGRGYWLNMADAGTVTFYGAVVDAVTVDLLVGWNLVGGVTGESVIIDPDGIVLAGTMYGYDGTYFSAESLAPGHGYWIATQQAGSVTVAALGQLPLKSATESLLTSVEDLQSNGFHKVTIHGGEKWARDLYFGGSLDQEYHPLQLSLPPVPPSGSFDARITGGWWISEMASVQIDLQHGGEPVRLAIAGEGPYELQLWSGTEDRGSRTVLAGEQVSLPGDVTRISLSAQAELLVDLPQELALEQNYPNPFNPGTQIRYALPKEMDVKLTVYNIMGQRVADLVDGRQNAGWHTVSFDASALSSGMYIYRMQAGDFVQARKMILIK